jgi:polar amino acid transport system ATP-binding protein
MRSNGGGWPAIVVTHEIGFAREVADRVAVMDDGRIIESGAAQQVLSTPEHARTRAFLERVLA